MFPTILFVDCRYMYASTETSADGGSHCLEWNRKPSSAGRVQRWGRRPVRNPRSGRSRSTGAGRGQAGAGRGRAGPASEKKRAPNRQLPCAALNI